MSGSEDTKTPVGERVAELMDRAAKAMAHTAWFEAERLALRALLMARPASAFDAMASVALTLHEARRQRYQQAIESGGVARWSGPITEETAVRPGCYLIEPPQVGADARRLRLASLHRDIPAAVLCREPATQLGLWPIVAVGAGFSVRARIEPPDDPESPDLGWFTAAMETIGDEALAGIDPEMELTRRIDALLDRLDAVPEHEKLHQFLSETCREAQRTIANAADRSKAPERKRARGSSTKARS